MAKFVESSDIGLLGCQHEQARPEHKELVKHMDVNDVRYIGDTLAVTLEIVLFHEVGVVASVVEHPNEH